MNKKGFTLIELLAVIVILAIIALIATPAVLNIIEDSKRSSAEDSARIISKEAETYYMSETTLEQKEVGDIDLTGDTLKYKGDKPSKGYVSFDEQGNSYLKMYMNGYCVVSDYDNTVESEKTEANDCKMGSLIIPLNPNGGILDVTTVTAKEGEPLGELPTPTREDYIFAGWYTEGDVLVDENTIARENLTVTAKWVKGSLTVILDDNRLYTNGEAIYFNPITNSACRESDYTTSNSKDLFKGTADSGCLKWHAFLDSDDNEIIRLILDHNTAAGMTWADAKTHIANVKNNDLYGWHEEVRSTARLILATEVNEIAPYGNGTWTPSTYNAYYYLHTGTKTTYLGDKGTNKYGWLFDNNRYCEQYGCNVQQQQCTHSGYWTSEAYRTSESWAVQNSGTLYHASSTSTSYGIRPVIEVSKDLLSLKKVVKYREAYGELPTPIREGYTFTGWYTTGGTEVLSDTPYQLTTDSKLYAQWEASTYTVTFKKGDEVVSTKTVTYNQPYGTLPPDQVKDGYLFKGWKKNDFAAITNETLVTTASDHDIEAIFVEITYLAKLYFNPFTNEACLSTDYKIANSVDGFRGTNTNGCMLWYAYKEDGDNYLMILDHNTIRDWTNFNNAKTEMENAKDDTTNLYGWHANVRSTMRMITVEELVELAPPVSTWDPSGSGYNLHTGVGTAYRGILGTNKYGWLLDNIKGCDSGACNVVGSSGSGYWTSSVRDDGRIWYVTHYGSLSYTNDQNSQSFRPVISVPKSKFTN